MSTSTLFFCTKGGSDFAFICEKEKTLSNSCFQFNGTTKFAEAIRQMFDPLIADTVHCVTCLCRSPNARSSTIRYSHALNAARRLRAEGVQNVTVNSLHPGYVRTELARYMPLHQRFLVYIFGYILGKVPSRSICHITRDSRWNIARLFLGEGIQCQAKSLKIIYIYIYIYILICFKIRDVIQAGLNPGRAKSEF